MLTLGNIHPVLSAEDLTARADRLVKDFPILTTQPKFEQTFSRARVIAARAGAIVELQPGIFAVQSERKPSECYTVNTVQHTCTCPAHVNYPERTCKHRLAVALFAGWFKTNKPAPKPQAEQQSAKPFDLERDYLGYIINPMRARTGKLQVKIVAIDAPANLVTIQVTTRDSGGERVAPFTLPSGDHTSLATCTPEYLKDRLLFQAAPVEDIEE